MRKYSDKKVSYNAKLDDRNVRCTKGFVATRKQTWKRAVTTVSCDTLKHSRNEITLSWVGDKVGEAGGGISLLPKLLGCTQRLTIYPESFVPISKKPFNSLL